MLDRIEKLWLMFGLIVASIILAVILLATGGCASSLDQAVRTESVITASLHKATEQWLKWDEQRQLGIVEKADTQTSGRAALERYRATEQATVLKALRGSWAAVVALHTAIDAARAGKQENLNAAVTVCVSAFGELQAALAGIGVFDKPPPAPISSAAHLHRVLFGELPAPSGPFLEVR